MPTRTASKPTSYTYTGSHLAAYLFNDAEISGGVVDDVSGNGEDLTLQGTAATESTDATHGKCLRGNGGGASRDPSTAFDSLVDFTVIASIKVEDNTNGSGSTEDIFRFENTSGSQDSINVGWQTSENVFARFEDDDTSNEDLSITDGFLNNAGEWATVAATLDGSTGDIALYIIIDGESTQVATSSGTGISSSASTNNILAFVSTWHGLGETYQIYDSVLNQTQIESWHVDPYQDFSTGTDIEPAIGNPTIAGQDVTVAATTNISPSEDTISIAGQDVTVQATAELVPAAASISITGQSVTLVADTNLAPSSGSISITGQDVTISGAVSIAPDVAPIAIVGQDVIVATTINISPAEGTISIAGETLTLDRTREISIDTVTLNINGQDVTVSALFATTDDGKTIVIPIVDSIVSGPVH